LLSGLLHHVVCTSLLKMEAAQSSETVESSHYTIPCNNPENINSILTTIKSHLWQLSKTHTSVE